MVYLMKGRLPWQGLKQQAGVDVVAEVKSRTSELELCAGLPSKCQLSNDASDDF